MNYNDIQELMDCICIFYPDHHQLVDINSCSMQELHPLLRKEIPLHLSNNEVWIEINFILLGYDCEAWNINIFLYSIKTFQLEFKRIPS